MKNATLFLLMLFFGCKHDASKNEGNVNEEIQVILNTFENATIKYSTADFNGYYVNFKHRYTSTDSLFSVVKFNHLSKSKKVHVINEYDILSNNLLEDKRKNAYFLFDVEGDYYQIRKYNDTKKFVDFNGRLSFSRVVFNKEKTKACYFFGQYEETESRLRGMESIVFVEKFRGEWVFIKNRTIWIA